MNSDYSFSGLNLSHLLTASLNAVADAQQAFLLTQTKAILDTCFTYDAHLDVYTPIVLTMTLTRSFVVADNNQNDPNSLQKFTTDFYLPLITVIPINLLGLETVDLDFSVEVSHQYLKKTEASFDKKLVPSQSANIMGKIATPKKNKVQGNDGQEKQTSNSFNISVETVPITLTLGLLSIINLYTQSITPTKEPSIDENPVVPTANQTK
jgi:hypothetical protein